MNEEKVDKVGVIAFIIMMVSPLISLFLFATNHYIFGSFTFLIFAMLLLAATKPNYYIDGVKAFQHWHVQREIKRMYKKIKN